MVYNLFGYQSNTSLKNLVRILEQEDCSLSPHSVLQRLTVSQAESQRHGPGGKDDIIVEPDVLQGWRTCLKRAIAYAHV